MYNIDRRGLESAITIGLIPSFKKEDDSGDQVTYYFNLCLDMIIGALNSTTRNLDDAIEEQLDRFPEDIKLPFLTEIIYNELVDIKRQFISAGFDNRLKYKLVSREVGRYKFYGIAMDLDETFLTMCANELENPVEDSGANIVAAEPTIEQLNEILNW
ncbi:hypothetical protein pETSU_279 [Edwardsiella phage pEt-SU]|uniref:Uncharacterized protein n=1 Tax=Edwardsiella phage pEt-SU TaxID=2562142 RepID=A0A4D6DX01_9CAUD|nr:hypothetical protein HOV39_gp243 [Edwardsiella phage pEt-SU]QBZ70860.1 hypothetical protein pETSU_279 [Edwardsiella phage pEt-SU]